VRAAVLSAESECAAKINEQRTDIAYAADSFKQFFNPQDVIDERTFRQIIGRAREELQILGETNAAVRRIAGAAAHQKTDDAVAQAVMGRSWADR
jgi:hypothetical protein